ncbi:MAG: 50S ribosomal protein L15 [Candidatus Buchananbacteria bacterium]
MLTLTNLKPAVGAKKKSQRVGRGNAGSGTYSGRGQKGQRARSGGRGGLKMLGLKQIVRRIPKQRGFKSIYEKPSVVNLQDLENNFADGETVTAKKILEVGLVKKIKWGVKILGKGKITKALKVKAVSYSVSAKEAIVKAGGQAQISKN